jgi:hypothetical protein
MGVFTPISAMDIGVKIIVFGGGEWLEQPTKHTMNMMCESFILKI